LHLENEDGFEEIKGDKESSEGNYTMSEVQNLQELLQRALNDKDKVSSISNDTSE
jgi:hypothetical protein